MTQQNLQAFISHLAQDPALQQQIAKLQQGQAQRSPDQLVAELVRIAAAAGFAIVPADLEVQPEVSDQQLDQVAAGNALPRFGTTPPALWKEGEPLRFPGLGSFFKP